MPFLDSLDVGNRAIQHLGAEFITAVTEVSRNNSQISFAYDKLRRTELRRNMWRFAIRKAVLRPVDTDTMVLDPTLYASTTTYLPGAIVKDTNGLMWSSMLAENLNNAPGGNNEAWDAYFGPMSIAPWSATDSYFAGELVYKPGAVAGSFKVFMSLQNSNTDVPDTATAWDATLTYHAGAVVSYSGSQWRSRIEVNLGITPADGYAAWDATITYNAGDRITGTDDFIYQSVDNGNVNHDPMTDGGANWTNTNVAFAWTRTPTIPVASIKWRVIDARIINLTFPYPIGSGPSSQEGSRNVYRLPAGFLKVAPQDPKAGSVSRLGAPSGLPYEDWDLSGNFMVSRDIQPILFRFVADVTRVSSMDDMFCEGLACRVAIACCEAITQSTSKIQTCVSEYNKVMGEARTVNAIEIGAVEPPEDDLIQCRV